MRELPSGSLLLTLIATNMRAEGASTDEYYMAVRVSDANNTSVDVYFWFRGDFDSIEVRGAAHNLIGVYSGSHLGALVGSFLWERFDADHEFLCDVFAGREGGTVAHVMPIETPHYAGA